MPHNNENAQPLTPAQATRKINTLAKPQNGPDLVLTLHIEDRLDERDLIMKDLIYLLKTGFVIDPHQTTTRPGTYKYIIEGSTPNSGGRSLAAVVIPLNDGSLKIVTIMWKDEK